MCDSIFPSAFSSYFLVIAVIPGLPPLSLVYTTIMPPYGAKRTVTHYPQFVPRRWVMRADRGAAVHAALNALARELRCQSPDYDVYARRTRVWIRGDFRGDYNRFVVLSRFFRAPFLTPESEFGAVVGLESSRLRDKTRPVKKAFSRRRIIESDDSEYNDEDECIRNQRTTTN